MNLKFYRSNTWTNKFHTFDQELFGGHSENFELDLIQLSSIIPFNFMLISINGKVFKYDIVTKEC